ncbi:uncharacterized protein LOC141599049 [Silene latifolia]|uniref:uncharacterized protein LOC141599049 n=1 Tax=Silene latifolia TaxID=37657 RepID=UPI003D77BC07
MADEETVVAIKKPPRPLVRLVLLLMSHRVLVSSICCIAGVVALLILPVLAKNTYISENALMPGSASSMLSGRDVADANKLIAEIMGLKSKGNTAGIEIPRILAKCITDLGAEASQFQFKEQSNSFHPLHFFSSPDNDLTHENISCSWPAISTVGIIRAPRGDGKESIVLVTPYNPVKPYADEALTLAVAYSVFSLLTQVTWLAKDFIWLAADSRYGEHESVAAWLKHYYAPRFDSPGIMHNSFCPASNHLDEHEENQIIGEQPLESFRRAGTMAAALVVKVNGEEKSDDSLSIFAEASNGQMPNLDLINIVNHLAVHYQGFHVKVGRLWPLLHSNILKSVGEAIQFLGKIARMLNPQWVFGVSAGEYVDGVATLASSLYSQALGVPTGSHGAFRDYQIDAVTLVISTKASPYNYVKKSEFLLRSGRLVEGVVRSVNNLLEKFHQSFFLYLLTGPSKFVSVGVYMIAFALLIAPLPIVAASLYSDAIKSDPESSSKTNPSLDLTASTNSWRWLRSARTVFIIHIWAVFVALYPYFICQIPNTTSTTCVLSWILLSILSLHFLYLLFGSPFSNLTKSLPSEKEWAVLKSVMIAAAFTGLSLMSVVNFAAAEIGALLIVPLCLMAHPLKLDFQVRTRKALARIACNVVLGLSGFPPFGFFLMKGLLEGFSHANFGEFWIWVESLWLGNSATYLYVMLVHLPCWVLCVHILLHRCH